MSDDFEELRKRICDRASNEKAKSAWVLADEHWGYVKEVLELHGAREIQAIGWHYKTAFIHGYKHGQQDG
jgi:hypothetical protein